MARLATTGMELNDPGGTGPDPTIFTGVTYVTSPVRTGTYALNVDQTVGSSVSNFGSFAGSTTVTYFYRAYVNFSALGTGSGYTGVLGNDLSAGIVLTAGVLKFHGPLALPAGATFTPSLGVWYRLESSYQSSSGAWEWRVDGSTIATGTTTSASAPTGGRIGRFISSGTVPLYVATFDDLAINDDTGAAQNSWPGDGKVVLLAPTSDNAKGTGWTNDAASSTSLFPSVDNEPPVGVADTTVGTGLHQIRNATSNANVNYDANLTTYTAAGIGAADTVNVLIPIVATAAPVVTSAKAGTVGVSANPVIANVALGAGGTAGAFWSGVAGGTYPTGWKWSPGTTTYTPSVTLGSAPVMRITQVTASTRIAVVCFMGMYVDYTPAVVIPPTPLVHQSIPFYPRASRPS